MQLLQPQPEDTAVIGRRMMTALQRDALGRGGLSRSICGNCDATQWPASAGPSPAGWSLGLVVALRPVRIMPWWEAPSVTCIGATIRARSLELVGRWHVKRQRASPVAFPTIVTAVLSCDAEL